MGAACSQLVLSSFLQAIQKGKHSRVLDIGSGTGLLSMFAARAGAKHITTVEGSNQMAECAARCIAANGLGENIHPLQMMSTDIVVGEQMPERADLCISEIVDVGLLGDRTCCCWALIVHVQVSTHCCRWHTLPRTC